MVRFFWNGIREHFQTISWKNILKLNRSALPRKLWQPFARLSSIVDDIFHNGPGGNTVCIDSSVKRWPKASKVSRFHRRVKFIMEHGFLRENCAASPFLYWRERERKKGKEKFTCVWRCSVILLRMEMNDVPMDKKFWKDGRVYIFTTW